jgi:putative acetyltransferase
MNIRQYQVSDAEAIAEVYRDAVIHIGCDFYSPAQIKIWSSFPENIEEFRQSLKQGLTLIAIEVKNISAFGQLYPDDRIAFLYTAKQYACKGYATAIYQRLEQTAIAKGVKFLKTEASRVSQFFFLKQGFAMIEPEIVVRQDREFERFKMQKKIA